MQIKISGHHLDITEAIEQLTREKLQRLEHHFDRITSVHVMFRVEKLQHIAEATLTLNRKEFHAHAQSDESLYTAIDDMVHKLDVQLVKYKEKNLGHQQ